MANSAASSSRTHPAQHPSSSELGFAAVTLAVVMPVLVLIFAFIFLIGWGLFRKTKIEQHCVRQVALMQRDLGRQLTKLQKLNPRARRLRQQRRLAEKALKAAEASAHPEAIAAAKAALLAVKAEQALLAQKQWRLLAQAHLIRRSGESQFSLWASANGLSRVRPVHLTSGLAVRPTPARSLTPDYVPLPLFHQTQAEHFGFQFQLFKGAPLWLKQYLDKDRPVVSGCGASLFLRRGEWHVRLIEVKSFLKSS